MIQVRERGIGTYYAKGADAARATPNASQVRGLVCAVKDNRVPPNPSNRSSTDSIPSAGRFRSTGRTRSST
jgi:hypothetical protein